MHNGRHRGGFVFFDDLDSRGKFILLGTKKGFRFSGLIGSMATFLWTHPAAEAPPRVGSCPGPGTNCHRVSMRRRSSCPPVGGRRPASGQY